MRWLERIAHLSVFVIISGFLVGLWPLPWLHSSEQVLDDARTNLFVANRPDSRIVIVDIDEKSLQAMGQWPWSRLKMAQLMVNLTDYYGARAIGLDFVLPEPSQNHLGYLQSLQEQGKLTLQVPMAELESYQPEDLAFANSLTGKPIVPGFVFKADSALTLNTLPEALATIDEAIAAKLLVPVGLGFTANIPSISQQATVQGFFDNPVVDDDGVYRRAALIQRYGNQLFPSLALAVTQQALSHGDSLLPIELSLSAFGEQMSIDYVQLGRYLIPMGEYGSIRVPYFYKQNGFEYISANDVFTKQVPVESLAGKIVLMGTSAPGLKDIRNTPVNSQMAGVEVHANIIRGILDNAIPHQPEWRLTVDLLLLLIAALFLWLMYRLRKPWLSMLSTGISIVLVVMLNFYFWQQGLLLSLAPFLWMVFTMYVVNSSWELLVENYNKRRITRLFGQYVPPEVVDDLAVVSPDKLMSGEEKQLSVMFSDVRGFTTISESLAPEQLTDLMNRLLTPLTDIIHQHSGTIDKYMGDAVMAFWGAPLAQPMHANKSVATAMKIQESLVTLAQDLKEFNVESLGMGIGINTGLMCVGNMGSEFRMAYTVMGDAVNLGARLEALTRQYGLDILVSEFTAQQADEFEFMPVDVVRVKGKTEPVRILTPLCLKESITENERNLVAFMARFQALYLAKQWPEITLMLQKSIVDLPKYETLWALYLERINNLQTQNLPEDWDGVFTHTSKQ